MLATFDALLAQPMLLLMVLAVGAAVGVGVEKFTSGIERDRRRAYWAGRKGGRNRAATITSLRPAEKPGRAAKGFDAADQLRLVEASHFSARPLLNKREAKLFTVLDRLVVARDRRWQVMAQVSLGEFLASEDRDAYGCINSKRVDFALMDGDCNVRHVIEYQGSGHYLPGGAAAARDAVKKEALRKAGIGYHEVTGGETTAAELRALIEKLVPPYRPPSKPA